VDLDAVLAVAADYANVASDGKLNIMGIFQEITPSAFPAAVSQMYLVISWDAGPAEFGSHKTVRITFMGPDPGEQIFLDQQLLVPEAPRPGERAVFHQILDIKGLPVLRSGPHAIYILSGGEEKARVPLYVREPPKADRKEEAESG
jgi:hypothetical protein